MVFAGMPRTGSTSLFHILGQHPGVFRPFRKEMGYFLFNHHKGERWYLDAYRDATDDQCCIDVTPEYFFSPETVERIAQFGDGVKVVIGVRDPAPFAVSLHGEYAKRYAVPPLEEFVRHYGYSRGSAKIEFSLASGVITSMLKLYRDTFGDRLFVYDFESFAKNPLPVLQSLERFMGLAPYFNAETFTNIHMNQGGRENKRWLTAILSAEPLIDAASRMIPAALLRRVAKRVYSGKPAPRPVAAEVPQWLRDAMAPDARYIAQTSSSRA